MLDLRGTGLLLDLFLLLPVQLLIAFDLLGLRFLGRTLFASRRPEPAPCAPDAALSAFLCRPVWPAFG
ncbi:hypothetical protein CU663_21455 [Pseudomonas syringae pv. actinidifoliorum]|nr:hypothetical protein [Pseudomonas syringae pv. actinidifoliorum]